MSSRTNPGHIHHTVDILGFHCERIGPTILDTLVPGPGGTKEDARRREAEAAAVLKREDILTLTAPLYPNIQKQLVELKQEVTVEELKKEHQTTTDARQRKIKKLEVQLWPRESAANKREQEGTPPKKFLDIFTIFKLLNPDGQINKAYRWADTKQSNQRLKMAVTTAAGGTLQNVDKSTLAFGKFSMESRRDDLFPKVFKEDGKWKVVGSKPENIILGSYNTQDEASMALKKYKNQTWANLVKQYGARWVAEEQVKAKPIPDWVYQWEIDPNGLSVILMSNLYNQKKMGVDHAGFQGGDHAYRRVHNKGAKAGIKVLGEVFSGLVSPLTLTGRGVARAGRGVARAGRGVARAAAIAADKVKHNQKKKKKKGPDAQSD